MPWIAIGLQKICPLILSRILWVLFSQSGNHIRKCMTCEKKIKGKLLRNSLNQVMSLLSLLWSSKLPKIWWNNGVTEYHIVLHMNYQVKVKWKSK